MAVKKLITGKNAAEMYRAEEAKAKAAADEYGKLWRFRIGKDRIGDDFPITFLDGDLDDEGFFASQPSAREHTINWNGRFQNIVCSETFDTTQPCPLCEMGNAAAFVTFFTVVDHTPYTVQSGENEGKTIPFQRKLFVAKRQTLRQLMKLAKKRGNSLAGCTFEVSRSNGKAAAVGDMFEFVQKDSPKELQTSFGDAAAPASYDEEIILRDRAELLKMGFGKQDSFSGGNSSPLDDDDSLNDEL